MTLCLFNFSDSLLNMDQRPPPPREEESEFLAPPPPHYIIWYQKAFEKPCSMCSFQAMLLISFFLRPKNINISFLLINYSHCEQALLEGALTAGRKRKLRRACNYVDLWNFNFPSNSIDWAVRFPPISTKRKARMKKKWKNLAEANDIITIVVSANQYFFLPFLM